MNSAGRKLFCEGLPRGWVRARLLPAGPLASVALALMALALMTLAGCGRVDLAGYSSNRPAQARLSPDAAADFADQIEARLLAGDVKAAIIFRTGRPRSKLPKGISFTHGAFWVQADVRMSDGEVRKGYAVYNLYHGEGDLLLKSRLHQDWPADFTAGSVVNDVGIIIPVAELQGKLQKAVAEPTYAAAHVDDYSLVSNPFDARYQNCNEFMLDVSVSLQWQPGPYSAIKKKLKDLGFVPSVIRPGLLQRVLGPALDPRLRTDDHEGEIETVTYESIAGFLKAQNLLESAFILSREAGDSNG